MSGPNRTVFTVYRRRGFALIRVLQTRASSAPNSHHPTQLVEASRIAPRFPQSQDPNRSRMSRIGPSLAAATHAS